MPTFVGMTGSAAPRVDTNGGWYYYAAFHLLVDEAAIRFFPNFPDALRRTARRQPDHRDISRVCDAVVARDIKLAKSSDEAQPPGGLPLQAPLDRRLVNLAKALKELQEGRHAADYDTAHTWDRLAVSVALEAANGILSDWRAIRGTPNADVFLAALLLPRLRGG